MATQVKNVKRIGVNDNAVIYAKQRARGLKSKIRHL